MKDEITIPSAQSQPTPTAFSVSMLTTAFNLKLSFTATWNNERFNCATINRSISPTTQSAWSTTQTPAIPSAAQTFPAARTQIGLLELPCFSAASRMAFPPSARTASLGGAGGGGGIAPTHGAPRNQSRRAPGGQKLGGPWRRASNCARTAASQNRAGSRSRSAAECEGRTEFDRGGAASRADSRRPGARRRRRRRRRRRAGAPRRRQRAGALCPARGRERDAADEKGETAEWIRRIQTDIGYP